MNNRRWILTIAMALVLIVGILSVVLQPHKDTPMEPQLPGVIQTAYPTREIEAAFPAPSKICGEYGYSKRFDAEDPRSNARLRIYIKGADDGKIKVCSKASKINNNDSRFRITHWYNNGTTDPWEKVRGGYATKVTTGSQVYVEHIRSRKWATLGKVTHAGVGSSEFSYTGV